MRLCDEYGENLFNAEDENDLEALSQLDKAVIEQLNQAIMDGEPKTHQPKKVPNKPVTFSR